MATLDPQNYYGLITNWSLRAGVRLRILEKRKVPTVRVVDLGAIVRAVPATMMQYVLSATVSLLDGAIKMGLTEIVVRPMLIALEDVITIAAKEDAMDGLILAMVSMAHAVLPMPIVV
jgi:hypothetical protein